MENSPYHHYQPSSPGTNIKHSNVLIGTPRPEKVNVDVVVDALPHGRATVQVVVGGLELLNEDGRDGTLIANAIITVSADDGK